MERLLEILALLQSPDGIEDAQLADLEAELQTLFDTLRAGDELTDEVIEALSQIADAVDIIRDLAATRIELAETEAAAAAAAEAERVQALADLEARVNPETEPAEGEEVEPVEAETEPAEGEEVEPVEAETEPAEAELEPVTAAGGGAPAGRPAGSRGSVPSRYAAIPRREASRITMRSAGAGGYQFQSRVEIDDALLTAWDDMRFGAGSGGRQRVATFAARYDENRRFPEGKLTDVSDLVQQIRQAAHAGDNALVADGGICGPVNVWYELQTVAHAGRSLAASIPGFNANRGGIRFDRPIALSDIVTDDANGAIGSMTAAEDAAGETNKTFQMVECGESVEVRVEAVWRQIQFGVLMSRTNPERTSQFTDLSIAAMARYAEQRLWTKMLALSTQYGGQQSLGATRDLLTVLNRAAIKYRAIERMPINSTVEVRLPAWVGMGLLPDDQTNALQSYEAQFEVTQAWVESKLALRNIVVSSWYEDDFTAEIAGGGGAQIPAYPSTFPVIMNHPGGWVLVDNGSFDLGVFRDGTMVNDNVFRTFAEEFWNVGWWGVGQPWRINFALCASGASAGSVEPACGS